jgi:hypothetical protein
MVLEKVVSLDLRMVSRWVVKLVLEKQELGTK